LLRIAYQICIEDGGLKGAHKTKEIINWYWMS